MTYAYNPGGLWTGTHQMTINGKRDNIQYEDFLASASHMGVKTSEAKRIIAEVSDGANRWMEFAEQAGVRASAARVIDDNMIARYMREM